MQTWDQRNTVFDVRPEGEELSRLQEENLLLHAVIDNFPGGILLYDRNLRLVLCNETQKRMLDYPPALFEFGLPSLEQIFRFNAVRGEYGPGDVEALVSERMRLAARREAHVFERERPNGTVLQIRGVPLCGGGFLTMYLDVTHERKQRPEPSRVQVPEAQTELTSWPVFLDRFGQVLARVRRGHVAAIHYIDLDEFKPVEARVGRSAAEALLRGVVYRLRNVARATDTVTRLGDDEFLILQSDVDRPSSVARLSNRVVEAIRRPFDIGGQTFNIAASLGVAMVPRDGTVPEELVAKAKEHLYRARAEAGLAGSRGSGAGSGPAL